MQNILTAMVQNDSGCLYMPLYYTQFNLNILIILIKFTFGISMIYLYFTIGKSVKNN